MNWQLIIVALLIAASAGLLLRRAIQWARSSRDGSSNCGSCSNCGSAKSPPVVTLESFDQPPRR